MRASLLRRRLRQSDAAGASATVAPLDALRRSGAISGALRVHRATSSEHGGPLTVRAAFWPQAGDRQQRQ